MTKLSEYDKKVERSSAGSNGKPSRPSVGTGIDNYVEVVAVRATTIASSSLLLAPYALAKTKRITMKKYLEEHLIEDMFWAAVILFIGMALI